MLQILCDESLRTGAWTDLQVVLEGTLTKSTGFHPCSESQQQGNFVAEIVMADFFDPTPEQQKVVLVDAATLREAERLIESCEHCNEDEVDSPFDWILDRVESSDPSMTDYILEEPAKCPNCRREVLEKTLVKPARRINHLPVSSANLYARPNPTPYVKSYQTSDDSGRSGTFRVFGGRFCLYSC